MHSQIRAARINTARVPRIASRWFPGPASCWSRRWLDDRSSSHPGNRSARIDRMPAARPRCGQARRRPAPLARHRIAASPRENRLWPYQHVRVLGSKREIIYPRLGPTEEPLPEAEKGGSLFPIRFAERFIGPAHRVDPLPRAAIFHTPRRIDLGQKGETNKRIQSQQISIFLESDIFGNFVPLSQPFGHFTVHLARTISGQAN